MPKPHPKDLRDDVVAVVRRREPGVLLKQIAADFGTSESCLRKTMFDDLAQLIGTQRLHAHEVRQ